MDGEKGVGEGRRNRGERQKGEGGPLGRPLPKEGGKRNRNNGGMVREG